MPQSSWFPLLCSTLIAFCERQSHFSRNIGIQKVGMFLHCKQNEHLWDCWQGWGDNVDLIQATYSTESERQTRKTQKKASPYRQSRASIIIHLGKGGLEAGRWVGKGQLGVTKGDLVFFVIFVLFFPPPDSFLFYCRKIYGTWHSPFQSVYFNGI